MKYSDFLKHLKSEDSSNVYIIYGPEKYLVDSAIKSFKGKYIDEISGSFNYNSFDNINENIGKIESACETIPFMAEKRIVEVRGKELLNSKSSVHKDVEDRLTDYINNIPESTILIILGGEKVDKRKKIYKGIKKHGTIIEMDRLSSGDLTKWISKQLKVSNKSATPKVLNTIAYSMGYLDRDSNKTLYDVKNEIEKLSNFPGTEITEDIVGSMLTVNKDINVFNLVEAVGVKDAGKAIQIFTDMLTEGEHEMKILFMIARQFRILNKVKILVNQGYSPTSIAPKISLPVYIAKKYVNQASRYKREELLKILNSLVELEGDIKSGKMDSRLGVEMLISSMV